MDLLLEVVDRLGRKQPFRVAVPKNGLTEFLSRLASARGQLPEIAIWTSRDRADCVCVDFAGADGEWVLGSPGDSVHFLASEGLRQPQSRDQAR